MPYYLQLLHEALSTEFSAIAPLIAMLLVIGLATAIIQAVFQFEDAAFGLLPKTIAMIVMALYGGFGLLRSFEGLATLWISHAGMMVHQPWS